MQGEFYACAHHDKLFFMITADETWIKSSLDHKWEGKAILLVDLDAFFASVEQLDHPEWRGKPVIVGGPSSMRGVVSTASYEARTYGVRSAMASSVAERLCPEGVWTIPRMERYKELSDQVMGFLHDETPYVQQVSVDEAFLDVTPSRVNTEHPVSVARRIQARVAELGISCSIGVATSKTVAKIASEQGKPRGLTVVYPGTEAQFLQDLSVREMSGIGAASVETLHKYGVKTLGQLACADAAILKKVFGKNAEAFRLRALGQESSEIETVRVVKSVSHETSFPQDVSTEKELHDALFALSEKVGKRLRKKNLMGTTVTVKVRFANRKIHTAQEKLELPTNNELVFWPHAVSLLKTLWAPGTPVRLIGVSMSGLQELEQGEDVPFAVDNPQRSLFDDAALFPEDTRSCGDSDACGSSGRDRLTASDDMPPALSAQKRKKLQSLANLSDQVNGKFGDGALQYGRTKRHDEIP